VHTSAYVSIRQHTSAESIHIFAYTKFKGGEQEAKFKNWQQQLEFKEAALGALHSLSLVQAALGTLHAFASSCWV
jgi:hypothetical protein